MLLAFRTKLVSTLAGVVGLDFGGTTLQDSPLNHMGAEVDWLNSNAGAITGLAAIATARATGVRPPDSWRSDTNVGDQRPALGRLVSAPSRDRLSTTAPETNRSAYIEEYHNDLLSAVEGFLADHFG